MRQTTLTRRILSYVSLMLVIISLSLWIGSHFWTISMFSRSASGTISSFSMRDGCLNWLRAVPYAESHIIIDGESFSFPMTHFPEQRPYRHWRIYKNLKPNGLWNATSLGLVLPKLILGSKPPDALCLPFWCPLVGFVAVALLTKRRLMLNVGHTCMNCEYDLTDNSSGRCPECGTPIPEEQCEMLKKLAADKQVASPLTI
mgnify:CR=1 FL=1